MGTPWFALFVHDISNNYQLLVREDALATARMLGYNVVIYSAERSSETQVSQIRNVLAEPSQRRPVAILVSPVRESALLAVTRESLSKGVAWVFLCRTSDAIPGMQQEFPSVPVFSVGADQTAIGRVQGKQMGALLRPEDEIVYIQGPMGTSSTEKRHQATWQELHSLPQKWSRFNADWSMEGGAAAVAQWVRVIGRRAVPPFVLVGQNDNMAIGARRALVDAGLLQAGASPRVLGVDGVPSFGHRMVTSGELTATVVVPSVAGKAMQTLIDALKLGRQPAAEILIDVTSYPALQIIERRRNVQPSRPRP